MPLFLLFSLIYLWPHVANCGLCSLCRLRTLPPNVILLPLLSTRTLLPHTAAFGALCSSSKLTAFVFDKSNTLLVKLSQEETDAIFLPCFQH